MPQVGLTSQADHSNDTGTLTTTCPTSYVLVNFTKLPDKEINRCGVIMADGKKCGKELARDKKASTKSMKTHLGSQHGIRDAHLPDQSNILACFKKVRTNHLVSVIGVFHILPKMK